jgi:hypothetical protein
VTALFRGGELEAFNISGSGVAESTLADNFNSAFARCAIRCTGAGSSSPGSAYVETESWTAQTGDFYLHFEEADGIPGITHTMLQVFSGTTANIRIQQVISGNARTWTVQYLDASDVWTTVGSSVILNTSLADYDLYVNITSGVIALYVRGNSSDASGDSLSLSHMAGLTKARLYSDRFGRSWSQVMADTSPTMGWRLGTYYPSGAGSDSAWTGTYANIDETATSDVDSITSDTANQVFTCAVTGPAVPAGYSVRDVTVNHRSKKGATGPTKIEAALRSAGTNYFSADISQSAAYAPRHNTWATNPATSAAFLSSEIAALQPGAKSIA